MQSLRCNCKLMNSQFTIEAKKVQVLSTSIPIDRLDISNIELKRRKLVLLFGFVIQCICQSSVTRAPFKETALTSEPTFLTFLGDTPLWHIRFYYKSKKFLFFFFGKMAKCPGLTQSNPGFCSKQWTYGPTHCLSIDTHIRSKVYKVVYF